MTTVRLKAPRKATETDISRDIRKALDQLRIPNWRMNSGTIRVRRGFVHLNPKGTADILAAPDIPDEISVLHPCFVWIEVKKPGGVQSKAQFEFAMRMRNRGHYYLLVESLDEVLKWLRENRAR